MTEARSNFTATLLPDWKGQRGGRLDWPVWRVCQRTGLELYDPELGNLEFDREHSTCPRRPHLRTLLQNGTVLVVGGKNGEATMENELVTAE